MLNTDLLTFELSFKNTSSKLLFNISKESINSLTSYLKGKDLISSHVKQLRNSDGKFLKIPNQKLYSILSFETELLELLKLN